MVIGACHFSLHILLCYSKQFSLYRWRGGKRACGRSKNSNSKKQRKGSHSNVWQPLPYEGLHVVLPPQYVWFPPALPAQPVCSLRPSPLPLLEGFPVSFPQTSSQRRCLPLLNSPFLWYQKSLYHSLISPRKCFLTVANVKPVSDMKKES